MEITLKNLQKKIPIPAPRIIRAAKSAVRKLEAKDKHLAFFRKADGRLSELSIVFVGTKRMRSLNKRHLGHDHVTDVLTFALGEQVAEIIICPQVACSNARVHQTSTESEIILYAIHGILHLAGFDDHSEKDRLQMRRMENKLLK